MNRTPDKFEKDFTCDLKGISAMLDACMDYIDAHEESYPEIKGVRSRLKWTITELLTNAIKHSGASICTISILCNENGLTLQKREQGKPLCLTGQDQAPKVQWPLEGEKKEKVFEIYQNGADALWVNISEQGNAYFFIKPIVEMEMPLLSEHIAEHFGLLILTKASDQFTYEFAMDTRTNLFRCHFNWIKR